MSDDMTERMNEVAKQVAEHRPLTEEEALERLERSASVLPRTRSARDDESAPPAAHD